MRWVYSEEHIYLEQADIRKVAELFEKEFGITNITGIIATTDSFEITRLYTKEEESLANKISIAIDNRSIQNFKKFVESYNRAQQD